MPVGHEGVGAGRSAAAGREGEGREKDKLGKSRPRDGSLAGVESRCATGEEGDSHLLAVAGETVPSVEVSREAGA